MSDLRRKIEKLMQDTRGLPQPTPVKIVVGSRVLNISLKELRAMVLAMNIRSEPEPKK